MDQQRRSVRLVSDNQLVIFDVTSKDVIRALQADGWKLKSVKGSHHHFIHPTKPGKVTVPHPKKELKRGLIKAIEQQAGLKIL